MDEKTKALLLEVAGFLTLITNGVIAVPDHARTKAEKLLNRIGIVLR